MKIRINEGDWFPSLDWFIHHNISVKKIIQKKGDVIIVNPHTIYWRKSIGSTLICSWNLMVKNERQIKACSTEYKRKRKGK